MYHYFSNLVSSQKSFELNYIMLNLYKECKLNDESKEMYYKNSRGTGSIPEFEKLLHEFTPMVRELLKPNVIRPLNSYSRIYFNDSILRPHVDRPGLDLTLSLCTYSNLDKPWPIYVETSPGGEVKEVNIKTNDAVLFLGTKMKHWREPLVCRDDQKVIQSFFHWEIVGPSEYK